jgi:hypothetical protein
VAAFRALNKPDLPEKTSDSPAKES